VRNRFKFLGIIVLTAVIGFSMSSCNNPTGADDRYRNGGGGGQEQPGVITWTAHPSGSPATNAIYIFFSRDPGSLSAGDFAITPAGGSATRGALSGSGITRRLAVSNVGSGAVSVSVNASNISGSQTVTLFAPDEGETAAITWTAAPAGSPTTTHLTFSFGSDPGPLQASNFTIIAGSGSAARGALSGSGTTRTLMISNVREGSVSVLINAPNISGGSLLVTLAAPPAAAITWTVTPSGVTSTGIPVPTYLDFTFSSNPGVMFLTQFTITAGSGSATPRGSLSGMGTTRRLAISNVRAGTITVSISAPSISGSQTVTIVDTGYFVFNLATGTITGYRGPREGHLTIPASLAGIPVTAIGNRAFLSAWGAGIGFTGVTIPNSVTYIGREAFRNNQLTSVTIPNSVTSIGDYAFTVNDLTSVTIPDSVTTIGIDAFSGNNLTTITIGAGVNIEIGQFSDDAMGNHGAAFRALYNSNGRLAGTYVFAGGSWSWQP